MTGADAPFTAMDAVIASLESICSWKTGMRSRSCWAAVAAHWLDCSPVWLMLIGPPSSAKTELIVLLRQLKHVHFLSDLSPNTLASGFNVMPRTKEPSLLSKLTNHVLAIKELTTMLSKRAEDAPRSSRSCGRSTTACSTRVGAPERNSAGKGGCRWWQA